MGAISSHDGRMIDEPGPGYAEDSFAAERSSLELALIKIQ
jgi:hypothetical protein